MDDKRNRYCEKCDLTTSTPRGLNIHKGKVHGKLRKEIKPKKLKMKKEKELKLKKLKIKELGIVNWKNLYKQYKKKQSESAKFNQFFKYAPTHPQIDFKKFDQKFRDNPVHIKNKVKEKIFCPNLDTTSFWTYVVKLFKMDLKKYSKQTRINLELFNLENTQVENFSKNVLNYRQIIDVLYQKIVSLFDLETNGEKKNEDEEIHINEVVDRLTMIKLRLELILDASLAVNFYESNRMVQSAEKITNDKRMTFEEKKVKVTEIFTYVSMVFDTIESINCNFIPEYKQILEYIKCESSKQKQAIQMCLQLIDSQIFLTPKKKIQEQVETQKTDMVNDEYIETSIPKENENELITMVPTEKNLEKNFEIVNLDDNCDESDQNDGFENDTIDDNLLSESSKQDKLPLNLACLYGKEWLNDEVATIYLQLINRYNPCILIYDTTFMSTLTKFGFDKFKKFHKKEDPLNKEGIIIPVHEPLHWYLIFFNLKTWELSAIDPYNFPLSSEEKRQVELEERKKKRLKTLQTLRDGYIFPLFESKYQIVPQLSLKVNIPPDIPAQNDGFNCGIYMLAFSKAILLGKKFDFSSEDIQNFRQVIIQEITTGKPTRKIKQEELFEEDIVEAQHEYVSIEKEHQEKVDCYPRGCDQLDCAHLFDHKKMKQENHSTAIFIEKEEIFKEAFVEEKPEPDFNQRFVIQIIKTKKDRVDEEMSEEKFEQLHDLDAVSENDFVQSYDDTNQDASTKVLDSIDGTSTVSNVEVEESKKKPQCEKCSLIVNTKSQLEIHDQLKHTDVVNYTCEKCEFQCNTKTKLEEHHHKIHTMEEIPQLSITETHKSIEFVCSQCEKQLSTQEELQEHIAKHDALFFKNVSKENESEKTFEQIDDLDQVCKEDLVQAITYDDILYDNKLIINEEAEDDDLHFDQKGHSIEQFHDDTVRKRLKERAIEEEIQQILDDANSDIVTPPFSPYQSDKTKEFISTSSQQKSKKIQIEKKRKLEENVADVNFQFSKCFKKSDHNNGMETEDFVSNTVQPIQDDINNPVPVVNNLIQYPQIKIFGDQKMFFYLDQGQYNKLSKAQQQKISDEFEGKVSYKGKALNRRRNFKTGPAKSIEFLEYYKTYIKNDTVRFHVHVNFKKGDIQTKQHEQAIFVENSLFRPENILKQNNETYPKYQMKFQNITIDQFKCFINIFK